VNVARGRGGHRGTGRGGVENIAGQALSVANTLGQPLSTFLQALRLGEYTQRLSDLGFEFTFDLKGISVDKLKEAPDLNMAWGHASRLVNAISHALASSTNPPCAERTLSANRPPSPLATKKKTFKPVDWKYVKDEVDEYMTWKERKGDVSKGKKGNGLGYFLKQKEKSYSESALTRWVHWVNRLEKCGKQVFLYHYLDCGTCNHVDYLS